MIDLVAASTVRAQLVRAGVAIGVFALLLSPSGRLEAQSTWASLGVGAGRASGEIGRAVTLELSHQRGGHVFMMTSGGILNVLEGESPFRDPAVPLDESVMEIGALYGRTRAAGAYSTFFAAGLAYTVVLPEVFSPATEPNRRTLGVPVRLGASVRPSRFIGVGVRAFVNLNVEEPTFGAMLNVEVGRFAR